MNIQELKTFISVAEHKNFTMAAKEIGLSQPATSRQIANLEESLGVQLFIRNPRNVLLTQKGQQLLKKAKDFEDWITYELKESERQYLKLGSIEGFLHLWLLPKINEEFLSVWNQLDIKVEKTSIMLEKLERGELDGCFTTENIQSELVTSRIVCQEQYVLISRSKKIDLKRLADYRWITFGPSDPLLVEKKKKLKTTTPIISVNSMQAIIQLSRKIDAVAAVPSFFADQNKDLHIYSPKFLKGGKIYLNTLNHQRLPTHLETLVQLFNEA